MSGLEREGVVLPLDGRPDAGDRNPWELLAQGQGMLVSWSPKEAATGTPWGVPLRATSTLSRQLTDVARTVGKGSGEQLYRLEIPAGFTANDLTKAIGGGFRGTLLDKKTGAIARQVKLIPSGGGAGKAVVAAGSLGIFAVIIAAEMAAAAEQQRMLTAIATGVERLNARATLRTEARLKTAEQTMRRAHTALLDGARIPESVGLGAAMNDLQVIRNESLDLLEGWERVLSDRAGTDIQGAELRTALGAVGKRSWDEFPNAIRTAYLAVALDTRRIMLTGAEAQARHPDLPLERFRQSVEDDLAERATELQRLRTLLSSLATSPLTLSGWRGGVLPHLVTDNAAENSRTQALFASLSGALSSTGAPALATSGDRLVIDADVRSDGEVQLLQPSLAPAQ